VTDVIEVDHNVIRINGDNDLLEKAILAARTDDDRGSQMSVRKSSVIIPRRTNGLMARAGAQSGQLLRCA
jgi:hypothetical protein